MPSFREMISAYNPATSSLIDNGADPAMFDLGTQASLNSTMQERVVEPVKTAFKTVGNWWNDPTTFLNDFEKATDSAHSLLVNGELPTTSGESNASEGGTPSAPGSTGGHRRAQSLVYQNADLAAAYGMNAATAYQEALSNTAHQREVADLRAAGLNPVLSATQGRGAGTVSSAEAAAASGGGSNSATSFKESIGNLKSVLQVVRLAKQILR